MVSGRCLLTLDGERPRELRAGDLVVLPLADAHVLGSVDGRSAPALSSLELARRTAGTRIVVAGPGELTTVVCGAFTFGDERHPAVAGFPRCIHVPGRDGGAPAWLAGLTRALAAVHADLAAPWTLPALARAAGLSRAAFAARFTGVLGQPPMRCVHSCRMRRAETLLRFEDATAAGVAARVGYGSEAAFSTAFSTAFARYAGVRPGAYRRRAARGGGPDPAGR